jgi:hypothetical protein
MLLISRLLRSLRPPISRPRLTLTPPRPVDNPADNLVANLANLANLVTLVTPLVPRPPTRLGLGACSLLPVGGMLVSRQPLTGRHGGSRAERKGSPRCRGGLGLILIRLER